MPGVVHEYVQCAVAFEGLIHQGPPGFGVGDVGMDIDGLAAGVLYLSRDGLAVLVGDVRHYDLRALAGEESGFLCAHAARGPGDDSHFAFQTHFSPP